MSKVWTVATRFKLSRSEPSKVYLKTHSSGSLNFQYATRSLLFSSPLACRMLLKISSWLLSVFHKRTCTTRWLCECMCRTHTRVFTYWKLARLKDYFPSNSYWSQFTAFKEAWRDCLLQNIKLQIKARCGLSEVLQTIMIHSCLGISDV